MGVEREEQKHSVCSSFPFGFFFYHKNNTFMHFLEGKTTWTVHSCLGWFLILQDQEKQIST